MFSSELITLLASFAAKVVLFRHENKTKNSNFEETKAPHLLDTRKLSTKLKSRHSP
jgi:hypothetical protein